MRQCGWCPVQRGAALRWCSAPAEGAGRRRRSTSSSRRWCARLPQRSVHARQLSMHSFRVWLACSLLAARATPEQIMLLLRWSSDEARRLYARMGDQQQVNLLDAAAECPLDTRCVRTRSMRRRRRTPARRQRLPAQRSKQQRRSSKRRRCYRPHRTSQGRCRGPVTSRRPSTMTTLSGAFTSTSTLSMRRRDGPIKRWRCSRSIAARRVTLRRRRGAALSVPGAVARE
mmetsp:Transcript_53736/g.94834  ORF Transcript_53736/g.94834 Transcript_53736/m.94834 type:complete len:229 (-) Transcript_53736:45-731(-)